MSNIVDIEIQRHCKGYARIRIDHLEFETRHDPDDRHVERLLNIFRLQGCHREDSAHVIPVVVEENFSATSELHTMNEPALSQTCSRARPACFAPHVRVLCLRGKHRVTAARKFLNLSDQWWTARVFVSCKWRERLFLSVGFDHGMQLFLFTPGSTFAMGYLTRQN